MKTNQKSLQKLTESEIKVNEILSLEIITQDDIKPLNNDEIILLNTIVSEKMRSLTGKERDLLLKKIDLFMDDDNRNHLWDNNHQQITAGISDLMQEFNHMPSITEIAAKTKLSRQTVHKHLKEYTNHPMYLQQIDQFRFMTSKVLAKVFKFAVNGDMAAAKLYFNVMGNMNAQNANNTLIQNQNNYIQINGTVLSQETIKKLNPDQLNTIENILKTALPQAVKLEVEK